MDSVRSKNQIKRNLADKTFEYTAKNCFEKFRPNSTGYNEIIFTCFSKNANVEIVFFFFDFFSSETSENYFVLDRDVFIRRFLSGRSLSSDFLTLNRMDTFQCILYYIAILIRQLGIN